MKIGRAATPRVVQRMGEATPGIQRIGAINPGVRRIGQSSPLVQGIGTPTRGIQAMTPISARRAYRTVSSSIPRKAATGTKTTSVKPNMLAHASSYNAMYLQRIKKLQGLQEQFSLRKTQGVSGGLCSQGMANAYDVHTQLGTIGFVQRAMVSDKTGELYLVN